MTSFNNDTSATGGIFADLGLDEVDEDPNTFPASTYRGFVYDCKVVTYKDAAKGRALVLTYKIADGGQHKGKTVDEWKSCNTFDDASKKAWLKRRLMSLGVPENRLSQVNPEDLIGTEVDFTTKKSGEYTNVTFVKQSDGAPASVSSESTSVLADDLL